MRIKSESALAYCRALVVTLIAAGWALGVQAGDGKVLLARKYRPGRQMVYATETHTRSTVRANPPALKDYLPPVPADFRTRQRTTLTVRSVAKDGSANLEARFDEFELESSIPEGTSQEAAESAHAAREDFARRLRGHVVAARFDRDGRLLSMEGAEEILQGLDPTMQDTMRQILRLSLEQMGGHATYPDRKVAPGEEWTSRHASQPTENYPFTLEGETTLKFTGRQRLHGVRAAALDFRFENRLRPVVSKLRDSEAVDELEARGMTLAIEIAGRGEGQMLVAVDDGRVLKTRARTFQTLTARMEGLPGIPLPTDEPVTLEVNSETDLTVESSGQKTR